MKLTNLKIVQNILSSLDGDMVDSVDGTVESYQVFTIVEDVYNNLLTRKDWAFMVDTYRLESVGDINKPNKLKIPDTSSRINDFRYKTLLEGTGRIDWVDLTYLTPEQFLDLTERRDSTNTEVVEIENDSGIGCLIINNKAPKYWTSFDNEYIFTDAYDSSEDTTLVESKTRVTGARRPVFKVGNNDIQDLPENMFPYLLAEAKSIAWVELRQAPNPKAEQEAAEQFFTLREKENRVDNRWEYVNYSKPAKNSRDYTWWKRDSNYRNRW